MDSPLVPIFVGVIAVTSLLQAAFVAGLLIASRKAMQKVDELEGNLSAQLPGQAARWTGLAAAAVRASETTVFQAGRLEGTVTRASLKVEAVLGHATAKVAEAGERMEETAERLSDTLDPVESRLGTAAAVVRGMRRALEVWRGSSRDDGDHQPR